MVHPVGPWRVTAPARATIDGVSEVLLATDADWIYDEVDAAIGGAHRVYRVREGAQVAAACEELIPDLIVLDLQIGNMGGMAATMLLKQEMRADRLDTAPVMMLLDREVDAWLAEQGEADAWMVKPLDSFRLRRAVQTVLDGGSVQEGPVAEALEPDAGTGGDDQADTDDAAAAADA